MRRSTVAATLAGLVVLTPSALAGSAQKVTLTLDWTPNPDHVGIYDAQDTGLFARAGLDVTIRSPSDPTAPLKLVGVGQSDLAVSYEQELFFAAAKDLPVVAVAAVVPQPLNSFIAIEPQIHSLRDLKGKTIGITGVPSDYATLDSALHSVGLTRKQLKIVTVGYNLRSQRFLPTAWTPSSASTATSKASNSSSVNSTRQSSPSTAPASPATTSSCSSPTTPASATTPATAPR
jgi:putative hydroxymethylpyrimidine transport system substrate-binding protein